MSGDGNGKDRREWDWWLVFFICLTAFTVLLYVTSFICFAAAIFVDRQPAEGNLGGFGGLVFFLAFVLSWPVGFLWDDHV